MTCSLDAIGTVDPSIGHFDQNIIVANFGDTDLFYGQHFWSAVIVAANRTHGFWQILTHSNPLITCK